MDEIKKEIGDLIKMLEVQKKRVELAGPLVPPQSSYGTYRESWHWQDYDRKKLG